jgi:glycerol 2-dehydrogenase (NADP+)/D-galacturonate reductase
LQNLVGTWQSQAGEVKTAVSYALQNGYKLIDGAYCYGNEDEVGEGLKEAFAAGVKREDVFVVTKVWATYNTRVAEALDKSLKSLGLEYVDLLLVVSNGVSTSHCCMFAKEFISTGLFC